MKNACEAMATDWKMIGQRFLAALRRQNTEDACPVVAIIGKGLCYGLLAAILIPSQAAAVDDAAPVSSRSRTLAGHDGAAVPSAGEMQPAAAHGRNRANFEREPASREARHVADWVVDSGDNRALPFVIVDKKGAKVFVFDAQGQLLGFAAALLGQAPGDDSIPGIGDRPLSSIRPEEKTTPAGRFIASLGDSTRGEDVLWVDYAGAVSMHRVITSNVRERRAQRLATATPLDNRITYGCINVPKRFYEDVVRPAFAKTYGIVYVLPEIRAAREVFNSYEPGAG